MLPEYMVLCSEFLEYLRKPTGTNIEVILWISLDCTNMMLRSPFVCLKRLAAQLGGTGAESVLAAPSGAISISMSWANRPA